MKALLLKAAISVLDALGIIICGFTRKHRVDVMGQAPNEKALGMFAGWYGFRCTSCKTMFLHPKQEWSGDEREHPFEGPADLVVK